MKKNNYIIFVIVTLFLLTLAFELQDVQVAGIRFGNSRLSDTTGYIATNRHFKVNGNFLSTGTITGTALSGTTLNLSSSATIEENVTMNGDNNTIGGFTQLGGESQYHKTKLVKVYIGTSVNFYTTAHGITNYRNIISQVCLIRDDSTGRFLPLGYNLSAGMSTNFLAYTDATNCIYYWNGLSGNIKTDTAYFWLTYTQ